MKHEETVKLIGLLVVAYPSYDKFKDESHLRSTVALWDQMFAEDDFKLVQLALEKHIATSKWPPSIAELRDIMADITMPNLLPADEAWLAVTKLLQLHERLYGPTTDHLPGPIAQAVDTVGYLELKELSRAGALGQSAKAGLARVAFTQAYEAIRERIRQQAALPGRVRERLGKAKDYYTDGSDKTLKYLEASFEDYNARMNSMSNALLEVARGLPEPSEPDGLE